MYLNAIRNNLPILLSILFLLFFSGCAQKAKTIQAGAAQFEAESLAAIQKIDEIHTRELQATPLTKEQELGTFINFVSGSSGNISLSQLDTMLHPLDLNLKTSEKKWQAFLEKLRSEYRLLTATFANLDKGSFFAKDSVGETAKYINKLTANMTAFAKSIKDKPPKFLRRWAELTEELEWVRDNKTFSNDVKELRYREIHNGATLLETEEAQLEREAIELCLKSANLGLSLKKLVEDYNKLSINDISEAIGIALRVAGDISGKDLSSLRTNVDDITNKVMDDTALKALFNAGLKEVNDARS